MKVLQTLAAVAAALLLLSARKPEPFIPIGHAALAPMAHTFFCLRYKRECRFNKFRPKHPARIPQAAWVELARINMRVNRAIVPEPNTGGLAKEKWLLWPRSGECHDYAVTKRHELVARGMPASALLLAEVITAWGEHHLVLVVRMDEGDFVLDNLTDQIRPWYRTGLWFRRIQSPKTPVFWQKIGTQ